jgi:transcription termination factor NusB
MEQVMIARSKEHVVEVDEARFTPAVREFIFAYGLKQLLNDAGSAGKNPDEKLGMAQKKLDALYTGEVRRHRDAVDEVTSEARKIAEGLIKNALRAQGRKIGDVDKDILRAKVAEVAERPDIRAKAQDAVAARKGLATDIEDLL